MYLYCFCIESVRNISFFATMKARILVPELFSSVHKHSISCCDMIMELRARREMLFFQQMLFNTWQHMLGQPIQSTFFLKVNTKRAVEIISV